MNIKQIGDLQSSTEFLQNFLAARGIKDLQGFLKPTEDFMIDPLLLNNMEEGSLCYLKHVDCNDKIAIVVDSDCDGYSSAALMYNYTKAINPDIEIKWFIHEGKQHGVEDLVSDIIDYAPKLLIIPDAGTNNIEECNEIIDNGIDIIILDHHIQDRTGSKAIIINNQCSEKYDNKALCGAAVVYKFCKYIDKCINNNCADKFVDLAALALISDMMDVTPLENRYIINTGLHSINNFLVDSFIEKQSFSLGEKLTPIGVAFYIVPLINGMIRVGTQEEKEVLFEAFINPMKQIDSTKRGHKAGELENICVQAVRSCVNAKNRQDRTKEKISDLLDIQIQNYCLDEHKILLIEADEETFDSELTGLIAMQISARYHKPVLLGKKGLDNMLKGSIRNCANSPISDLKEFLLSSGYFDYVSGHPNAAGFGIELSNIDKFIAWADTQLENVNFNEGCYEVDLITNSMDQYLSDIITDLSQFTETYGQGFPEPIVAITDIAVSKKDFSIMGKNQDTVKFIKDGITYVVFKAQSLIDEFTMSFNDNFVMTVIGKPNLNEWAGNVNPQILVDAYEIKPMEIEF